MTEPWCLGLVEARTLLSKRELSAAELLESVLGRISATEDQLRAWAFVDVEGARAAASAADRELARGVTTRQLLGIPIGIKDVIDTKGIPTEAGSAVLRGRIPVADAPAVHQLRAAGGIVLGKTVTHEFAFGQGDPPTCNPWDRSRYPGGSSIGSGVAVAVGSAPASLGTDTAGSVRNPASINGLVGLKPSSGLVDTAGLINVSRTMDQIGPIARSVRDCGALLDGISKPEALRDLLGGPASAGIDGAVDSVRIAVDRGSWSRWGVTDDVQAALLAALSTWTSLGAKIVEVELPEMSLALPAGLAISLSEASALHAHWLNTAAERYQSGTRVMLETGALVTTEELALAHAVKERVGQHIEDTLRLAGASALVGPTLPSEPPLLEALKHSLTGQTETTSVSAALLLLSPASLTGFPALSVPCGMSKSGMPIGMQMLGTRYSDALLLRLAHGFEQASPWRELVPIRELDVRQVTGPSTRADP